MATVAPTGTRFVLSFCLLSPYVNVIDDMGWFLTVLDRVFGKGNKFDLQKEKVLKMLRRENVFCSIIDWIIINQHFIKIKIIDLKWYFCKDPRFYFIHKKHYFFFLSLLLFININYELKQTLFLLKLDLSILISSLWCFLSRESLSIYFRLYWFLEKFIKWYGTSRKIGSIWNYHMNRFGIWTSNEQSLINEIHTGFFLKKTCDCFWIFLLNCLLVTKK